MQIQRVGLVILLITSLFSGCAQQSTPLNNGAAGNYAAIPNAANGSANYGANANAGSTTTYGYGNTYPNGASANGSSAYGSTTYTPNDLRNPTSLLSQRVIYFDYDSSSIKPEFMPILNAHAALLTAYPQLRLRLEGHADERGSREYNVALSERRGYAVLDYLLVKGAQTNQMDVIGYGEEIPVDFGHNESAWSKNRRVEIKYAGEQ